jgi:hypothetical protein
MKALLGSTRRGAAVGSRTGVAGLLATAAVLAFLSCDDGPSEPPAGAGDLVVHLVSPNGSEGAAVFETSDEGIVGVDCEACDVFYRRAGGTSRIVVLMTISGEVHFTMSVEDRQSPPELQVVQVADASNELRDDVSGYTVRFSW